ncbi:MAG: helix-turn-helix domain-containing protein [Moraxellaceae bacterium]|nr:helix-turn-helix domain-containing protein [Moraxellaceae bacterium]
MKKRNMLSELQEGLNALQGEREGKLTLKRVHLEPMEIPEVEPAELRKLREDLHLSRAVFARAIRTNPRTVESWEQGRSKPNTHAALLIKLVEKFPETLEHLRAV